MMKSQDLLSCQPQEIIINILYIQTITRCKFVCKSWRDLIESPDFEVAASSHLSKSSSFLAVVLDKKRSKPYEVCAFEDERLVSKDDDAQGSNLLLRHNLPTPHKTTRLSYLSSVNGLFFMLDFEYAILSYNLSICNPTTHEYTKLPPPRIGPRNLSGSSVLLGFGMSKRSGQYKVVKASNYIFFGPICEVYTLGTGVWMPHTIDLHPRFQPVCSKHNETGAFVNGNLHWLVSSSDYQDPSIHGFDLETECFTISFAPPLLLLLLLRGGGGRYLVLSALEDRLCLCDVSPHSETVIWVMKDYGDEKSWTKQLSVINALPCYYRSYFEYFFPVKVYEEDGDMLFAAGCHAHLYRYSNEKKIIRVYDRNLQQLWINGICGVAIYKPNFVSLKSLLGNQNV